MQILLELISSIVRFINVSTWMLTNHTSVKIAYRLLTFKTFRSHDATCSSKVFYFQCDQCKKNHIKNLKVIVVSTACKPVNHKTLKVAIDRFTNKSLSEIIF
jgi:hypothetical protein